MELTLLTTILLMLVHVVRFSVYKSNATRIQELHQICISLLPIEANALPELKALVCGENFAQLESSAAYIASGLIHLFVVSGAHLILLKKLIDWFLNSLCFVPPIFVRFTSLLLLTIYAGFCEFNPPVTRSLIALFIAEEWLWGRLFWSPAFKIFFAGILTLLLNPPWIASVSLQLSWLIALGLLLGRQFLKDHSILMRQSLNYVLIFPTLMAFQFPQPLTILMNVIFAPVLELFLFPLGLLVTLIPVLTPTFDLAILALKSILAKTEMTLLAPGQAVSDTLLMGNWVFILSIHLLFSFHQLSSKRRSLCKT